MGWIIDVDYKGRVVVPSQLAQVLAAGGPADDLVWMRTRVPASEVIEASWCPALRLLHHRDWEQYRAELPCDPVWDWIAAPYPALSPQGIYHHQRRTCIPHALRDGERWGIGKTVEWIPYAHDGVLVNFEEWHKAIEVSQCRCATPKPGESACRHTSHDSHIIPSGIRV
jgi:hypothetical protein